MCFVRPRTITEADWAWWPSWSSKPAWRLTRARWVRFPHASATIQAIPRFRGIAFLFRALEMGPHVITRTLMTLARHRDYRTTGRYVRVDGDHLRAAVERLADPGLPPGRGAGRLSPGIGREPRGHSMSVSTLLQCRVLVIKHPETGIRRGRRAHPVGTGFSGALAEWEPQVPRRRRRSGGRKR